MSDEMLKATDEQTTEGSRHLGISRARVTQVLKRLDEAPDDQS
tara:strand:+ start:5071 stop:5199 length:129 start_codon:yes stop_codon:yes gene_type:complete